MPRVIVRLVAGGVQSYDDLTDPTVSNDGTVYSVFDKASPEEPSKLVATFPIKNVQSIEVK